MAFDLMNEKGVAIDYMYGFSTYSLLPIDSLTFINNQLITKSYLNKWGYSNQVGKIVNNRIQLNTVLVRDGFGVTTGLVRDNKKITT